tara:strand:- start:277 stop:519 length:243 start_codon:yes stop_codon:yes gene_type:complete
LKKYNYCSSSNYLLFLFSISKTLKETSRYNSELKACAKMKAFNNNKESSELFKEKAAEVTKVPVKLIGEYCKKLSQQNLF